MGSKEMKMQRTKFTTSQQDKQGSFATLASAILSRARLGKELGKSFGGDRDLYEALGYPISITFKQYNGRYSRQDIAKRIIDAPVNACWRRKPDIVENLDEEQTDFEKAFIELQKSAKVFHYLNRVDRISGIGTHAVLLIGLSDGEKTDKPVKPDKNLKIIYLRAYNEENAKITKWEEDTKNPRYGYPEEYELLANTIDRNNQQTIKAHHSRVLHVTEGRLEDDVYGTPRLECVYNRLQDLELISGSSAEMFYRGAFPGYGFKLDKDTSLQGQALIDLQDEIEEYMHGLKRYIRLQGLSIENFEQQVASPKDHIDIQLDLISGGTYIPKRILIGSERGELASSQDETAWNNRVDERRKDYVESWVLRPFIDKCIEWEILPTPKDGYTIDWPPIHVPTEKEQADVARIKAEALQKYASTPGADTIIPPEIFLRKFLGYSGEEVTEITDLIEKYKAEEEARIDEEEEIREDERIRLEKEEEKKGVIDESGGE